MWRRRWSFLGIGRCRACVQVQTFAQSESQNGFSRIGNVAIVSGRSRAHRSRTCADKPTDQGAFAAAGQASNQSSAAGSATHHGSGALAFTLGLLADGIAADGVGLASDVHRDQANRKAGCTLELAGRVSRDYNAADSRPCRNDYVSIEANGVHQRTMKAVAGGAGL